MIASNALPPAYVPSLSPRQNVAPSSGSLRNNNRRQTEEEPQATEENQAETAASHAPRHNTSYTPAPNHLFSSSFLAQLLQQSVEREEEKEISTPGEMAAPQEAPLPPDVEGRLKAYRQPNHSLSSPPAKAFMVLA